MIKHVKGILKITRPHLSSHEARLNFVIEIRWSKHSCAPQQCA